MREQYEITVQADACLWETQRRCRETTFDAITIAQWHGAYVALRWVLGLLNPGETVDFNPKPTVRIGENKL